MPYSQKQHICSGTRIKAIAETQMTEHGTQYVPYRREEEFFSAEEGEEAFRTGELGATDETNLYQPAHSSNEKGGNEQQSKRDWPLTQKRQ